MSESTLGSEEAFINRPQVTKGSRLNTMDKKLNLLNEKVDKLLHFQEDLTEKLQKVNEGIDDLGKGLHQLCVSQTPADPICGINRSLQWEDNVHQVETQNAYTEILNLMKATHQDASKYKEKMEKMETSVDAIDKMVKCLGEMFKNSKVVDFILKGCVPWWKGSLLEILEETKDKPEDKGAKGKHAPPKNGIQTESKNSLEENKRGTTSDEQHGIRGKVNVASTVLSKEGSRPCAVEKMAQLEPTEPSGSANGSKDCPRQKETGNRGTVQKDDLFCPSGGNLTETQNMDKEKSPQKQVTPKWKGGEKSISRLDTPAGEAVSSTSKSGCEVIRTRPSVIAQMNDAQDKALKGKEGSIGSSGGKRGGALVPLSLRPVGQGGKHLQEPSKVKEPSKDNRTEPTQELKGVHSFNKWSEQIPKLAGPASAAPLAKAEGKGEDQCKGLSCPSSTAKDFGKDLGGSGKSPKETAKITKDIKTETVEPRRASLVRRESRSRQGAGKLSEITPFVGASQVEEMVIDDSPPPPAPFEHRIVSIKQTELTAFYTVSHDEVLGGGRFGQVHKCIEKATGLCLAAKIIKVKLAKEREEVKNEINIMNQLSHVNLIQLYDAFESKNNLTLIMEYVDGGELFDRIIDENYNLTELDAILFTKQICEGIYYLHQQYILHLDLKPENILCVSHTGNQIKIIDFGLARRYKPREKLKVNFGTPEFLAPEVVNYDFVSFPTDMWSVGIIAYMLVSGLSPFLGETDAETMNYIVNCSWDFDAEAFEQVSEEAKDFVSRLLIKEKSGRISAANCLKHEWLTNLSAKAKKSKARLKSQMLLQRYMAQKKWKKHFYAVTAANRLRRFPNMPESPAAEDN
ncbi:myosin light chain kinase 3 [Python bivittatus]|uniref:Myosin light chain kinase 3 n=1 Tax=Python bivittatus TaxID=176946 RepID=A0A9F2RCR6_PYTBI|nr:myosin light chain kinase 3 [Python bivittatus]